MAIDLLNSFLQRGQNVSSNQKNTTSNVTTQTMQNLPQNLQVMRAMRALQAGQTIQGEVVSVKGDEVQLAIMKDVIIDARLAQSMNLTPGITMPFQVKANTGQGLSLIPLFTNTAADPNILKALDAAKIPMNGRSVEMVQTLMEKGMPIDKQALQELYRDVVAFKDATVRDLVSLHQMKLPVTQENLTQLSMYQNNKHYLKDVFSQMGSAIGEQLEQLVAEGKTDTAKELLQQLQQLFQSNEGEVQGKNQTEMVTEEIPVKEDGNSAVKEQAFLTHEKITEEGKPEIKETPLSSSMVKVDGKDAEAHSQSGQEIKGKEMMLKSDDKEAMTWNHLTEALTSGKAAGKISGMFDKLWNKVVSSQWMMEPEMVAEKKNVKEYYEKLNSQIRQLEKIFEEAGMEKSPAAKTVQNTASNLDFMSQLNQMHAYIQLPLKMANQNAHGELYVFANKKNLNKQDGKVTALLHLDMEHLGKMDVYVALENKKVSTNFYLEREEYLNFLEEHMDLLTARLNKRGYVCDIKTVLRNSEEEPIIKTIEKQQDHPMLLSMQAFDVRA